MARREFGEETAGIARRYYNADSPIELKNTRVKGFRAHKLLQFITQQSTGWRETSVLLAGLKAWVICPTKINKSVHRGEAKASTSNSFVQSAMRWTAAGRFGAALKEARLVQREGLKDWSAHALLMHPSITSFPYD